MHVIVKSVACHIISMMANIIKILKWQNIQTQNEFSKSLIG
jgi:hypothetical protein